MHLRDEHAPTLSQTTLAPTWPNKYDLFGVEVSATTYTDAASVILTAAKRRRGALVTALAVHGVVEAANDPAFSAVIRDFDMVTPDGQPVRIALNALYGAKLASRVAGPDLMLLVCERCEAEQVGVYLYGSTDRVVKALKARLLEQFPRLKVVGSEPSLFRPIQPHESRELADRINASGAGVVFIGLGCPLQERFSHQHQGLINAVQFCVGAAFDFHAGTKRRAPEWMREIGMEWFFRMMQEPRRLCKRYITTNATFILKFVQQLIRRPDSVTEDLETAADRAVP
jgi:N-acetylglucosaminyldiphosphoundecaprenol N-acetyl-beta-D-mannosaminyltransferase